MPIPSDLPPGVSQFDPNINPDDDESGCVNCGDDVPAGDLIEVDGVLLCSDCAYRETGEDGDPDRRDR